MLLLLKNHKPSFAALLSACKGLKPAVLQAVTALSVKRWYPYLDVLSNLVHLSVRRNNSWSAFNEPLPGIEKLTGLSRLSLAAAAQQLPEGLAALTGLLTLQLTCWHVRQLPATFFQLTRLTQLVIKSALAELPGSISQLDALQQLQLHSRQLQALPQTIGKLAGLTQLSLNGCSNLTSLPDSISQLAALQWLQMQGCMRLEDLPSSIGGLAALQHLDLEECIQLQDLQAGSAAAAEPGRVFHAGGPA